MAYSVETGDLADSQQLNETRMGADPARGRRARPQQRRSTRSAYAHQTCPPIGVPGAVEAAKYTGVQDYDDYAEGATPYFYDPDDPRGGAAGWPKYPGLMDKAQAALRGRRPHGPRATSPSATTMPSCRATRRPTKSSRRSPPAASSRWRRALAASLPSLVNLTPEDLEAVFKTNPAAFSLVPPDPDRRFVSKAEYKDVFRNGAQADGHGFDLMDPAEETASKGAAGYYSFVPIPGLRMIALDTVCEGGVDRRPARTATSTTRSSSGSQASSRRRPRPTSSSSSSATMRSRA